MKKYSETDNYILYQGSMLNMLDVIESNSIDSIVTDPPYELNFMSRSWDNAGVSFNKETWEKCYEVLKPGGYLLAFGGSRTYHRIACAIEDAGFEIRDCIMWIYGSGFPKSMNIGLAIDKKNGVESIDTGEKINGMSSLGVMHDDNWEAKDNITRKIAQNEWNGWGTCLKPAYEPIIIARKPFKGSLVDNVIENGVGGLNIDECRIGTEEIKTSGGRKKLISGDIRTCKIGMYGIHEPLNKFHNGRFPANVILTYDKSNFDEVCGGFPNTKSIKSNTNYEKSNSGQIYGFANGGNIKSGIHYEDNGSAARYFYCAKASKKDRDEGLDEFEEKQPNTIYGNGFNSATKLVTEYQKETGEIGDRTLRKNTHPTVKPTELMQYLVRLVTPKNGTILDPFMGSGSTGKATMYENNERNANYKFIGIELTEEYLPIAEARISYVYNLKNNDRQMSIYDFKE